LPKLFIAASFRRYSVMPEFLLVKQKHPVSITKRRVGIFNLDSLTIWITIQIQGMTVLQDDNFKG